MNGTVSGKRHAVSTSWDAGERIGVRVVVGYGWRPRWACTVIHVVGTIFVVGVVASLEIVVDTVVVSSRRDTGSSGA